MDSSKLLFQPFGDKMSTSSDINNSNKSSKTNVTNKQTKTNKSSYNPFNGNDMTHESSTYSHRLPYDLLGENTAKLYQTGNNNNGGSQTMMQHMQMNEIMYHNPNNPWQSLYSPNQATNLPIFQRNHLGMPNNNNNNNNVNHMINNHFNNLANLNNLNTFNNSNNNNTNQHTHTHFAISNTTHINNKNSNTNTNNNSEINIGNDSNIINNKQKINSNNNDGIINSMDDQNDQSSSGTIDHRMTNQLYNSKNLPKLPKNPTLIGQKRNFSLINDCDNISDQPNPKIARIDSFNNNNNINNTVNANDGNCNNDNNNNIVNNGNNDDDKSNDNVNNNDTINNSNKLTSNLLQSQNKKSSQSNSIGFTPSNSMNIPITNQQMNINDNSGSNNKSLSNKGSSKNSGSNSSVKNGSANSSNFSGGMLIMPKLEFGESTIENSSKKSNNNKSKTKTTKSKPKNINTAISNNNNNINNNNGSTANLYGNGNLTPSLASLPSQYQQLKAISFHYPFALWTNTKVQQWLNSFVTGMRYIEQFEKFQVSGQTLLGMNDNYLSNVIGISDALHRREILQRIASMTQYTAYNRYLFQCFYCNDFLSTKDELINHIHGQHNIQLISKNNINNETNKNSNKHNSNNINNENENEKNNSNDITIESIMSDEIKVKLDKIATLSVATGTDDMKPQFASIGVGTDLIPSLNINNNDNDNSSNDFDIEDNNINEQSNINDNSSIINNNNNNNNNMNNESIDLSKLDIMSDGKLRHLKNRKECPVCHKILSSSNYCRVHCYKMHGIEIFYVSSRIASQTQTHNNSDTPSNRSSHENSEILKDFNNNDNNGNNNNNNNNKKRQKSQSTNDSPLVDKLKTKLDRKDIEIENDINSDDNQNNSDSKNSIMSTKVQCDDCQQWFDSELELLAHAVTEH